jgi:hypothetical protein
VGAVFGLVAAAIKSVLDARRKVDEDLRGKRDPGYRELWQHTRLFSKHADGQADYSQAEDLQRNLTSWIYGDSGLYLSRKSQSAYDDLMKSLSGLGATDGQEGAKLTDKLPDVKVAEIREKCSKLQEALTGDLLSRTSGKRLF